MNNNIILKDLFDTNELQALKNFLNKFEDDRFIDEPQLARTRLNTDAQQFPRELFTKLNKIATEIFGSRLILNNIYSATYSKSFGNPTLTPHLDPSDAVFCIDYQLDANTEWDLAVEGQLYRLKNNNALTIATNVQAHWRKIKTFNEGDFVTMVFFHFHDYTKKVPFTTMDEVTKSYDKWKDVYHNDNYPENVIE
jgi:hypothetical protein